MALPETVVVDAVCSVLVTSTWFRHDHAAVAAADVAAGRLTPHFSVLQAAETFLVTLEHLYIELRIQKVFFKAL